MSNKTWKAEVTLGYSVNEKTKKAKRITRAKGGFKTKKEALEYLPQLKAQPVQVPKDITFSQLYEKWLPAHEGKVGKSTMNCYKAAYKYYKPIWHVKMSELKTAGLQECLNSCGQGKRTQQNMKALGTMLYRYAAKDDLVTKNYAELLDVGGGTQEPREPFTEEELDIMWSKYPEVPNLDLVLILCYTGFRLEELLSLTDQDLHQETTDGETWWYFIGGEKTEAGKNRLVAISPRILPLVLNYQKTGYLFSENGKKVSAKKFREEMYYPALEAAGLPKRVPHCCRHTYATLMKNVEGVSDKDKMASIGHTSMSMTNKYTHADKKSQKKLAEAL
jgi:integrase